jgi:hypothetical protein
MLQCGRIMKRAGMRFRRANPRLRSSAFGLTALLALESIALPAAGDPAARARAQVLVREAKALETAGNCSQALVKLAEARSLAATVEVHLGLARCKENLGRLVEALDDVRFAEQAAPAGDAKQAAQIRELREWLEARVPVLIITRGAGSEGSQVMLDGVKIGEEKFGTPLPVDPGDHVLRVILPDAPAFEKNIHLESGESAEIELVPPASASEEPPAVPPPTAEPVREAAPESSLAPWIVGGAGIASLAASGVFFALRGAAVSDLEAECVEGTCPESLRGRADEAKTYATLAGVTLGVGLAAVGVAGIWLYTEKRDATAEARRVPRVGVGLSGDATRAGLTVIGRF